jgi:RNA polymerase sigma-70 factor, ECF subfamily
MNRRPHPSPQDASAWSADLELVRTAMAGDPSTQDQLVDRLACVPAMLRSRNRRMGSPLREEELADVVQETLSAIWTKLHAFEGRARIETWAFRFAMHEFSKGLERRVKHATHAALDGEESLEHAEEASESLTLDSSVVQLALERVGDEGADVLRLKHFDELTFEEIGSQLSLSSNTVKARYYRALEKLRELLAPQWKRERA